MRTTIRSVSVGDRYYSAIAPGIGNIYRIVEVPEGFDSESVGDRSRIKVVRENGTWDADSPYWWNVEALESMIKIGREPIVNVPCVIRYRCRDIGYGVDRGRIKGTWTGEIDCWGKYTIARPNGKPTLYLFADEIRSVDPA